MFHRKSGTGTTRSGEAPRQVQAGDIHGRKSGLALFFAVTFTTTWAFWLIAIALGGSPTSSPTAIPYLLGGFGPVFGAIVVRARRARRREPVPARTVKFRQGTRLFWVPPLLVPASASVVAGALLADLLGGPGVSLTEGRELISTVGGVVPFFVSMLVAGPLAEEPGWRGTAYPRLRASMSRLRAGLLLGAVWAVCHLPLFFIEGTVQAEFGLISWSGLMFSLSVIPVALLTGYAYERAGVAASIAVHLGFNATMAVLTVESPVTQAFIVAVQVVLASALLATRRDRRTEPPVQAGPHPHQALTEASPRVSPTRG
ncbi:type II CAAX endopeptidase family protein [Streptomyces sp. AK02-01A]|uniref:type II CAAX endopeptidase family protein n=1 Tax=Streptomyces sp. AK02-01A TaxID=3028648 RepID=UPI0029AE5A95|nr:type II CAAX endopeptidase family protein [Streptomyces sp. AK02-01A]MDX3855736.1 type II CAAX endopeptidase family protein [Streptomyces sp. AK02-01A]